MAYKELLQPQTSKGRHQKSI